MNGLIFLRSMTAYGKALFNIDQDAFLLEITSVNRKHLEMHFTLPKNFQCFEFYLRKLISSRISRGSIHVAIRNLGGIEGLNKRFKCFENNAYIKDVKRYLDGIRNELDIETPVSLDLLLNYAQLLFSEAEECDISHYQDILENSLRQALDMLVSVRETEGAELGKNIMSSSVLLSEFVLKIQEYLPEITEAYKEKIRAKILESELFPEEKSKLLKEVACLIEKIDITEEIIRVLSHLQQLSFIIRQPFSQDKDVKGKQLEFLMQEIARELNTMNAKNINLSVIKLVLDAKIELEKIREQVQNIE